MEEDVSKYYFEDISEVIITEFIKVTSETYNKFDSIMFSYYGDKAMEYLPIILSFNNLPDITEIPLGTIIKIPDINSLITQLIILDDNDDLIVQGVNNLIIDRKQFAENKNQTIASPKLNITLDKVKYEPLTGTITY